MLASLLTACPAEVDPPNMTSGDSGSTDSGSTNSGNPNPSGTQSMTADPPDGGETFDFPMCECGIGLELDPIPAQCADLGVPPMNPTGMRYAAWVEGNTVLTSTHEDYYCWAQDLAYPEIECPCSGAVILEQYEFAAESFEVGETTATLAAASASCGDVCWIEDNRTPPLAYQDVAIEILAVSDTCIIGETTSFEPNTRFYAARDACP